MGHARLIDTDYRSNWPPFLKRASESSAVKPLPAKLAPTLIDMRTSQGEARLKSLIKDNPIVKVLDNYDEQLAELLISKDAHLYRANEEVQRHSIAGLIKDHYGRQKPWQMGSWVNYPWSGSLVHVLGKDLFLELRTIRNRDLITAEEQKILRELNIACLGMSVGSSGALALALSGISNRIKLADGAVVSGSNLNRILTGVESIGEEKAEVIARKIYEMNPYAEVFCLEGKVTAGNIEKFLDSPWSTGLVVDEIDDLEIKIRVRVEARKRRIPVIMATELADNVMLDVERFDLEPDRPLFHGLIKGVEELLDNKPVSQREWMKHATSIIGTKNVPLNMQQSLLKIGSKIVTHPQLGSTAMMTGGVLAFAAKQIGLGRNLPSQRKSISLEKIFLPEHRALKHARRHRKHTKILKKSIGSM